MRNFPKINLKPEVISMPPESMQKLDGLIESLETLCAGKQPDSAILAAGLATLHDLFDLTPTEDREGRWMAERYSDSLGSGMSISLKEQSGVHHLSISRRQDGALFDGIWLRIQDTQWSLNTFNISEGRFILSADEKDYICAAPAGVAWASLEEILGFIPDWLRGILGSTAKTFQPPSDWKVLSLVEAVGGKSYALKGRTIIGNEEDADLRLDDREVSLYHAIIEPVKDGWQITDLNSPDGVQVNGTRIKQRVLIKPGDEIVLGVTRLVVQPR